jgi:hypothetical protein
MVTNGGGGFRWHRDCCNNEQNGNEQNGIIHVKRDFE